MQKHRDELQAQEANEWAAKREPILQKLSVDIEKLRSSKTMTDREFCEVWLMLLAGNSKARILLFDVVRLQGVASQDRRYFLSPIVACPSY